jgi:hypothetical protein
LIATPPEGQLAPAGSVTVETSPAAPDAPSTPLQTWTVAVTSGASRTPLPLVSMPDRTAVPPAGQLAALASLVETSASRGEPPGAGAGFPDDPHAEMMHRARNA